MTTQKEAKRLYGEKMTRLAEKAGNRIGVSRNEHGDVPPAPMALIAAEAAEEIRKEESQQG